MRTMTFEENLKETIINGKFATRVALVNAISEKIAEELDTLDSRLFSVTKRWENYGTWNITLWVNSAHFGGEIAEKLNNLCIITHDEEKVGDLEDFRQMIDDEVMEWAYDFWCEN